MRSDTPIVLRDAWHVLVHLHPAPVVARMSSLLPYPEGPESEGIVRELAVASHLAHAGCAVVPPAAELEAVPHYKDGHVVTFWRYVEPHDDPDPRAAGRALRVIHEALPDYEGELPRYGHPSETAAMLDALPPSEDVELVREIASRRPDVGGQALHWGRPALQLPRLVQRSALARFRDGVLRAARVRPRGARAGRGPRRIRPA